MTAEDTTRHPRNDDDVVVGACSSIKASRLRTRPNDDNVFCSECDACGAREEAHCRREKQIYAREAH